MSSIGTNRPFSPSFMIALAPPPWQSVQIVGSPIAIASIIELEIPSLLEVETNNGCLCVVSLLVSRYFLIEKQKLDDIVAATDKAYDEMLGDAEEYLTVLKEDDGNPLYYFKVKNIFEIIQSESYLYGSESPAIREKYCEIVEKLEGLYNRYMSAAR